MKMNIPKPLANLLYLYSKYTTKVKNSLERLIFADLINYLVTYLNSMLLLF